MVGGLVRQLWKRLQNFIFAQRKEIDDLSAGECFNG